MVGQRTRQFLKYVGVSAGVLLVFASFFYAISFLQAETPLDALASGKSMPMDWSAGVKNHGKYYRWWTISDQPYLFGCSIAVLAGGIILLVMNARRKRATEPSSRQSSPYYIGAALTFLSVCLLGWGFHAALDSIQSFDLSMDELMSAVRLTGICALATWLLGGVLMVVAARPAPKQMSQEMNYTTK